MRYKLRAALLALPIILSPGAAAFAMPVAYPVHREPSYQHRVAGCHEPLFGRGFGIESSVQTPDPEDAFRDKDDWPAIMMLDSFETRSASVAQENGADSPDLAS